MNHLTKLVAALLPALAVLMMWSLPASADPEMAKKTKKECTVCHVSEDSPELNATGEYYQKNKKLPQAPKKQ
ncbi:MAG: hypothetical protein MUF01_14430 [Bryobacterales bacterium]|jgi:hypothetical protein|nr:hypothetical protein [Bryobacterales bacterium]